MYTLQIETAKEYVVVADALANLRSLSNDNALSAVGDTAYKWHKDRAEIAERLRLRIKDS